MRQLLQRLIFAIVDDVVFSPRRDDKRAPVFQRVILAIEAGTAFACLDTDELIEMVRLGADLFSRLQTHQDQLTVGGGEQHLTKVVVANRRLFDVNEEMIHRVFLSWSG